MFKYKIFNSDIVKCLKNIKTVNNRSIGKAFDKQPLKIECFLIALDFIAIEFEKYKFDGVFHRTLWIETNFLDKELIECLNSNYHSMAIYHFFKIFSENNIEELVINVTHKMDIWDTRFQEDEFLFNDDPTESNYEGV